MKLSVIVVSYNMCPWLRQGLSTLARAAKYIDHELIVVDDASSDDTVAMINTEFSEVKLIVNERYAGTARSRNLGIVQARGEYVLLVNPDTISSKKTLEQVVNFMDAHPDAGCTGVRMLNHRGNFLTSSRTGFTRPWGGLLKLTGLARFFSKSRLYKGNDGWIAEEEFDITEVDVVHNAFMLLRRSVIKEIGLLDERFVQFGHHIDLSFRIRLAGYKNYYYPKTYILNFEHQHETKFSWGYFKNFYGAMMIFAAKYLFKMPQIKLPRIPRMFAPTYEVER